MRFTKRNWVVEMDQLTQFHLERLRMATTNKMSRKDLLKWVTTRTYLAGKLYSTVDHEYQERILGEQAPKINIIKSAQTGCSEMSLRMALGLTLTTPGPFSVGYIFPSAGFSEQYSKTRFDPIVTGSPFIRSSINSEDLTSAEVKTFGPGKQIYFKGAATGNSAISTSLDALFRDEYSFMDQEIAGDYNSRLIHSPYKIEVNLSTPSYPGDPISSAYGNSAQWINMCRCNHCSHSFNPDYYLHVRIPGWSRSLDEINADNLHQVRIKESQLLCPSCEKEPDLSPAHRHWECLNPDSGHQAVGFRVSPFDVPKIVTLPDLITSSTVYKTKAKFKQFALGQAAADAESGFTEIDLDGVAVQIAASPFSTHVMGIDVGMVSHFAVGGVDGEGRLGVVHCERVPLSRFRERYFQLTAQYRVSIKVMDIQPYTDLVLGLSQDDPNLYGARYVTRQGLELFQVKSKEENMQEALPGLREVQINRNAVFDKFLSDVRSARVWFAKGPEWDLARTQMLDMKRASATLRNGEFTSIWQKSVKGNDHYHHAIGAYLSTAAAMRGVASGTTPVGLFGVSSFKVKDGYQKASRRPMNW